MRGGAQRKLDYTDYAAIPDDGRRHEALEGSLFVTPAPSPLHQRVSKRLQRQLEAYFETSGLAEVFDAPIEVILSPHDILQPDLVVVARPEQVSARGIEGAPLLVVEVLSPSTTQHDRVRKARRYAALGIPHYWIVDPDACRIEYFGLTAGGYESRDSFEDLVIDFPALWR